MSGVTDDCFRTGGEIVPQQGDKPLGLEVVLPLISDDVLEDPWSES